MHLLRFLALVIVSAFILGACGATPVAQAPTEAPKPTAQPTDVPKPTEAPKPTAQPTEAPKPTTEPTTAPEPTTEPTEASTGDMVTQPIVFGPLTDYKHPKDVFSIQYPKDWKVQDSSTDTEATVVFTDPTGNGVLVAHVIDEPKSQDEIELENAMRAYLKTILKDSKNLKVEDGVKQKDNSIRVDFAYDEEVDGKTVPFEGGGFVEQHGELLSFLLDGAPVEQWGTVLKQFDEVVNTYKVDSTATLGGGSSADKLADVEIGDLQTYTHSSGTFALDVPTNWNEPKDKSGSGEVLVIFSDQHDNAEFVADVFKKPDGDLGQFLGDFIKNSYKDDTNFQMADPQPQKDGSVRVTFSYDVTVQGVKATMLGNSFIEDHGDKAAALSFVVPQDQFKTLEPKLENIINSFKVDEAAKLP